MKNKRLNLKTVRVKKFRNFIDSGEVDIEEDVTCLVGKNESGKTAYLNSLYRLNPARENVSFDSQDHYPAWIQKKDRLRGVTLEEVTPIVATFEIPENIETEIEDLYGNGILKDNTLELKKEYGGKKWFTLHTNEKAFINLYIQSLDVNKNLQKEFKKIGSISDFNEFVEGVQSRNNVSQEDKDTLSGIKDEINNELGDQSLDSKIYNSLKKYLPKFFYFDSYSTLPYSVDVNKILNSNEQQLTDGEITARSLLRLAAADEDYLTNPNYEIRKRELENVANALTEDVLEYWSQNPNLRVQPDITLEKETTGSGRNQQEKAVIDKLKIRIWDDRHLLSLRFNEHSSRFQWFFSFLAAFSEFEYKDEPIVILLDEPALGLHARAQKDYLRFIEERLSPNCQVIYTTHSPFMVEPNNLKRVRMVEDKSREEGSKVTSEVHSTDPDTLFPLQGALGYDIAQNLFIAPNNLVVEGTSDYTYLSILSELLHENDRTHLDENWSIVPVGGADMIPTFVALLGNHLDVTVLVDSQKKDHQKLMNLSNKGYLSNKRIITIGGLISQKHADIEDLFSVEDYLNLFNEAFDKSIKPSDLNGTDRVISKISRHLEIDDYNHGIPANYLMKNKYEIFEKLSDETLKNFESLFNEINSTLN